MDFGGKLGTECVHPPALPQPRVLFEACKVLVAGGKLALHRGDGSSRDPIATQGCSPSFLWFLIHPYSTISGHVSARF